ncbi:MAG TPA: hypothetical protein VN132_05600 [Bdellovibrio sp.]|nr:hypothetical protein [Bdellovibrio sp.]
MSNKFSLNNVLFACGFVLCLSPLSSKLWSVYGDLVHGSRVKLLVIVPFQQSKNCIELSYGPVDDLLREVFSKVFSETSVTHPRYKSVELIQLIGYVKDSTYKEWIQAALSTINMNQKVSSPYCSSYFKRPQIVRFDSDTQSLSVYDFLSPVLLLAGYILAVFFLKGFQAKHIFSFVLVSVGLLSLFGGARLLVAKESVFYSVKLKGFPESFTERLGEIMIYDYIESSNEKIVYTQGEATPEGINFLVKAEKNAVDDIVKDLNGRLENEKLQLALQSDNSKIAANIEVKESETLNKIIYLMKYILLAVCLSIFIISIWLAKRRNSCRI